MPPGDSWLIIVTPPADGAFDMAMDDALMDFAEAEGRWVFRVYGWSRPTLSFGRNEAAARTYSRDKIAAAGLDAVRRPTGGRAILHDREITYSCAAPLAIAGDLRESYGGINRLLVDGLRGIGVEAVLSATTTREIAPTGATPCFDHPSAGELVAAGKKLAGSAQWRSSSALLQHGSILIDDDQYRLQSFLISPLERPVPAAATLTELLGRTPSFLEVADSLAAAVIAEHSTSERIDVPPRLAAMANERRSRYLDDAWTWRR